VEILLQEIGNFKNWIRQIISEHIG